MVNGEFLLMLKENAEPALGGRRVEGRNASQRR